MNHYNILLSTELLGDGDYSLVLQNLSNGCDKLHRLGNHSVSLGDDGSHLVTFIKPVQDLEESIQCNPDDVLWSELTADQTLDNIVTCHVPIADEQSESASTILLDRLHKLADNIPKIGVFVDVYWLVKDENLPSIEDNIELYGAYKQLLEWNNAYFTFVTFTSDLEITNLSEPWVTMLRGHVTTIGDLYLCDKTMLWRGAIQIVGSNIPKAINLPGFELMDVIQNKKDSDPELMDVITRLGRAEADNDVGQNNHLQSDRLLRLLSSKMEVISQLDRQDIPLLYYTGLHCKLCVRSESKMVDKSRTFIQRLDDNPRLCYLVKLCHGTSWRCADDDSIYKDKITKEKKVWADFVQENIEHVLACPIQPELDGDLGQHVLMLCGGSDGGRATCEAHVLRSPADIRGSVGHQMVVDSLWNSLITHPDKAEKKEEAEELVSHLPHFTGKQFLHLHHSMKHAQIVALQNWIALRTVDGVCPDISTEDLLVLLHEAQSNVITDVEQSEVLRHQLASYHLENEPIEGPVRQPLLELEKMVLAHQHEADTKFARHRSNESLAGLSPPPRGKVVTLNAREFLKFFENDGSAAKNCSTDLSLKKSSMGKTLTKCTVDEVKNTSWPNSETIHFHDIYYNQGMMEAIEGKSKRLLSRFLTTETSSTCIYRQTHSPSVLAISTEITPGQVKVESHDEGLVNKERSPNRVTRSARKRRSIENEDAMRKESKRLYAAKKAHAQSCQNAKNNGATKAPSSSKTLVKTEIVERDAKLAERISRAQRHKRKLEEIVKETLKEHGIQKANPLFKPCALRLYNTTKSFVKDLTSSVGLRQAMTEIAKSNVKMVVTFEKMNSKSTAQK